MTEQPEPDERLRNGGSQRAAAQRWRLRLATGLVAVAAVLLVVLGAAQALHRQAMAQEAGSATATARAHQTPPPIPAKTAAVPPLAGPRLSWQQAVLPYRPASALDIFSFAVVAVQGGSAYACHATSDETHATLQIYRTTDRALHWTPLTQITEPSIFVSCGMVEVDALDTMRVLVEVQGRQLPWGQGVIWYELSEDGGATWTRLDMSTPTTTYGLATVHGKTYALRQEQTGIPHPKQRLFVSVDHLHTWQPIDRALASPNAETGPFWLSADGELLAQVTTSTLLTPSSSSRAGELSVSAALWRSTDGGAHWSLFPSPPTLHDKQFPLYVVGVPHAGQPWQVCIRYDPEDPAGASMDCTFDNGKTWSVRLLLCIAAPCILLGAYTSLYTMASDGAVLTMALAEGSTTIHGLYRLPKGASTWQYLGPIAGRSAYFFAETPQGGILWAFGGATDKTPLSGAIVSYESRPGALTTATYP